MSIFEDIVESYKKKFNNDLSDLNAAQISHIVSLVYKNNHDVSIEKCTHYMSDYVNLVRDVLDAKSK